MAVARKSGEEGVGKSGEGGRRGALDAELREHRLAGGLVEGDVAHGRDVALAAVGGEHVRREVAAAVVVDPKDE